MTGKPFFLATIAGLALASAAGAADWPTMRGPDGSGAADSGLALLVGVALQHQRR